jgi:anionic cell wall polymer biosynthesis LytR-Cps2A-Psr (LCP) family protein
MSNSKAKAKVKVKKHLRRRSNWYIYLISFAATFAALGMVILAFQDILFPVSTSTQTTDRFGSFIPSDELDVTVLFMMGDNQGSIPSKYMLMNYRPADEIIVLVPLSESTRVTVGSSSGKLTDLYRQGGASRVVEGIKTTLGIECEFYVQFDRSSFTSFTAPFGEIQVNVPYDFTAGGITLRSGDHRLAGADLFVYMMFANFPQAGEEFELVITGTAMSALINTNLRNLDPQIIQEAFNSVYNNASTNLTFRDYSNYQRALVYTSQNSFNPAVYYLPAGEYNAGEFVLSNQSIADILNRFNLA